MRPEAATPQGADLRIGFVEVASESTVMLHIESELSGRRGHSSASVLHRAHSRRHPARDDWHERVREGMVGVVATIGASRQPGTPKRHFLVPRDEYHTRFNNPGGNFVLDPSCYHELPGPDSFCRG
jgi:hypothetical protein